MEISEPQRQFLEQQHTAAMITVDADGRPRPARVAVGLIDGQLWSSGTATRTRTDRLRKDPRCTVFVFDAGWYWLSLDANVRILEDTDAPQLNLRLFRLIQSQPTGNVTWFGQSLTEEQFLERMIEEQRLIYEFDITHVYGIVNATMSGMKE